MGVIFFFTPTALLETEQKELHVTTIVLQIAAQTVLLIRAYFRPNTKEVHPLLRSLILLFPESVSSIMRFSVLAFCDVIKGTDHLGQVMEQYPKPGGAANQSTVFYPESSAAWTPSAGWIVTVILVLRECRICLRRI